MCNSYSFYLSPNYKYIQINLLFTQYFFKFSILKSVKFIIFFYIKTIFTSFEWILFHLRSWGMSYIFWQNKRIEQIWTQLNCLQHFSPIFILQKANQILRMASALSFRIEYQGHYLILLKIPQKQLKKKYFHRATFLYLTIQTQDSKELYFQQCGSSGVHFQRKNMVVFGPIYVFERFLIILTLKPSMNNFNPFTQMFCQFWMPQNMLATPTPYFTPVIMYPQFVQQQAVNPIVHVSQSITAPVLEENKANVQEKKSQTARRQVVQEKGEQEKITVQNQSSFSRRVSVKNDEKKPNRPQTYLTQKAYYMKQKIKGKYKLSVRILRKREKTKEQQPINVVQEKPAKKVASVQKTKKKKMPIMKDSQKQKKVVNKIRQKIVEGCSNQFAKIPKLISGIRRVNQFCRQKYQNLMHRQIINDQKQ